MLNGKKLALVWGATALALATGACAERGRVPTGSTGGGQGSARVRGTLVRQQRFFAPEGPSTVTLPPVVFDEPLREGRAVERQTGIQLADAGFGGSDLAGSPTSYTDSEGHTWSVIFNTDGGGPSRSASHLLDGRLFAETRATYTEQGGTYVLAGESMQLYDEGQLLLEQSITATGTQLSARRRGPAQFGLLAPALLGVLAPKPLMAHVRMKCEAEWVAYGVASAAMLRAGMRYRVRPTASNLTILSAAGATWFTTWQTLYSCMSEVT